MKTKVGLNYFRNECSKVKKQFFDLTNISRNKAGKTKNNSNFSVSLSLMTQHNPLLVNYEIINKRKTACAQ